MSVTAAQIRQLRRMTNETDSDTYSDAEIGEYIETYPVLDALGNSPWVVSETDTTLLDVNPDWTATYDLNSAAADIWAEKAAALAAAAEISQRVFEDTGDLQPTSKTWANAQAFASMNNSYLSRCGVTAVVTGITVDQGEDTGLVQVSANLEMLFPSVVPEVVVTERGSAEIRVFNR